MSGTGGASDAQRVRDLLARADAELRVAVAADAARRRFRLREPLVVHRRSGVLGWVRDRGSAPDPAVFEELEPGMGEALYRALVIVEREAKDRAVALEAQVDVKESETD